MDFDTFIVRVQEQIIDPLITLLALAAFIVFIWGTLNFIWSAGDDAKRTAGKRHMIWGLVGLTILFGARAIVAILQSIVGT